MTTIAVGYPSSWDVSGWSSDHAADRRPGLWPYGLDRLGSGVPDVGLESISVSRRSVFSSHKAPASDSEERRIAVGWDETTLVRLLGLRGFDSTFGGVIWNTDAAGSFSQRLRSRSVRTQLGRANGLWCLSRPQVDQLTEQLGRSAPPVEFVRFGIDTEFFRPSPYPDRPLVASVGGDRDRDTDTLFAAMQRVHSLRPDVEIVIQTSSTKSPPDGVKIVPHFTHVQLRSLYQRASVVAIATRPNMHVSGMTVSLEAMSTGRPVVITQTPGMDDYVHDGIGRLVRPSNHAALADNVLELLGSPDAAEALGKLAQENVQANHTSDAMASQITQFILR